MLHDSRKQPWDPPTAPRSLANSRYAVPFCSWVAFDILVLMLRRWFLPRMGSELGLGPIPYSL